VMTYDLPTAYCRLPTVLRGGQPATFRVAWDVAKIAGNPLSRRAERRSAWQMGRSADREVGR